MKTGQFLKSGFRSLKTEIYVLFLAYRDPRVPWYAKAFLVLVIAYALSPVDIIPDCIPVPGYIDDLILLPLGIFLAIKIIPEEVRAECRRKAVSDLRDLRLRWPGLALVILLWLLPAVFVVFGILR